MRCSCASRFAGMQLPVITSGLQKKNLMGLVLGAQVNLRGERRESLPHVLYQTYPRSFYEWYHAETGSGCGANPF